MRASETRSGSTLYWNHQGQVNCGTHAPCRDSDMWKSEGWQRVPSIVFANVKRVRRNGCERCRATAGPRVVLDQDGRAVVREGG